MLKQARSNKPIPSSQTPATPKFRACIEPTSGGVANSLLGVAFEVTNEYNDMVNKPP